MEANELITNVTVPETNFEIQSILQNSIYAVIILIGLMANSIVCYVTIKMDFIHLLNYLIINLAIANLIILMSGNCFFVLVRIIFIIKRLQNLHKI